MAIETDMHPLASLSGWEDDGGASDTWSWGNPWDYVALPVQRGQRDIAIRLMKFSLGRYLDDFDGTGIGRPVARRLLSTNGPTWNPTE